MEMLMAMVELKGFSLKLSTSFWGLMAERSRTRGERGKGSRKWHCHGLAIVLQ